MLMVQSAVAALARKSPEGSPAELVSALNTVLHDNIRHRLQNEEHVTFTLLRYVVLLYTDGVTEARAAGGEQFFLDRLTSLLQDSAELPMPAVIEPIYRAVVAHAKELDADVTLLALRRR